MVESTVNFRKPFKFGQHTSKTLKYNDCAFVDNQRGFDVNHRKRHKLQEHSDELIYLVETKLNNPSPKAIPSRQEVKRARQAERKRRLHEQTYSLDAEGRERPVSSSSGSSVDSETVRLLVLPGLRRSKTGKFYINVSNEKEVLANVDRGTNRQLLRECRYLGVQWECPCCLWYSEPVSKSKKKAELAREIREQRWSHKHQRMF